MTDLSRSSGLLPKAPPARIDTDVPVTSGSSCGLSSATFVLFPRNLPFPGSRTPTTRTCRMSEPIPIAHEEAIPLFNLQRGTPA
jgi:hypothetical protein